MRKKIWLWNHYAIGMAFNRGGRHYYFSQYLKKYGYEPTVFCSNTSRGRRSPITLNGKKYRRQVVDDIPFVFVKTAPQTGGNGILRVFNMTSFYKTFSL